MICSSITIFIFGFILIELVSGRPYSKFDIPFVPVQSSWPSSNADNQDSVLGPKTLIFPKPHPIPPQYAQSQETTEVKPNEISTTQKAEVPLELTNVKVEETKNVVSMESNADDEMDVAENNIVFRPLFSYRRQSAQKTRYSKNFDDY